MFTTDVIGCLAAIPYQKSPRISNDTGLRTHIPVSRSKLTSLQQKVSVYDMGMPDVDGSGEDGQKSGRSVALSAATELAAKRASFYSSSRPEKK